MSKPKLEKWQQVNKAFPTEPGIDWSKMKSFNFTPIHKIRVIPQPFRVEQIPKKAISLKGIEKENE